MWFEGDDLHTPLFSGLCFIWRSQSGLDLNPSGNRFLQAPEPSHELFKESEQLHERAVQSLKDLLQQVGFGRLSMITCELGTTVASVNEKERLEERKMTLCRAIRSRSLRCTIKLAPGWIVASSTRGVCQAWLK